MFCAEVIVPSFSWVSSPSRSPSRSAHGNAAGRASDSSATAHRIAKPVVTRVRDSGAAHLTSDCPMAGAQIAGGLDEDTYSHPLSLLRKAYGI